MTPRQHRNLTRNEGLKANNPILSGTISQTLADASKDRFSEDDYEFLKFHGIYQQDDRDKRKTGKQYIYMVRGRLPGGVLHPSVYLAFDQLCQPVANNTLRITTRQGFQFHGVTKGNLGKFIKGINDAMATTLAACGDVNRNVMAAPTPATSPLVDEIQRHAAIGLRRAAAQDPRLSSNLGGRRGIEVDRRGRQFRRSALRQNLSARENSRSPSPFPRSTTSTFLPTTAGSSPSSKTASLAGYNLIAGGGMGMSHGNAADLSAPGGCHRFHQAGAR